MREIIGVIELSSNAIRAWAVTCDPICRQIIEEHDPPYTTDLRLGEVVFEHGYVPDGVIRSLAAFLKQVVLAMRSAGCQRIRMIGTEAMRRASNQAAVCAAVFEATAVPVQVLTGEDEARLMLRGIQTVLPQLHRAVVGDLGAGSTELALIENAQLQSLQSLPLGHLRVYLEMKRQGMARPEEQAEAFIRECWCQRLHNLFVLDGQDALDLVFCGGVAKQYAKLSASWYQTPAHCLPVARLEDCIARLAQLSLEERVAVGVKRRRVDTIVVGGHILLHICRQAQTTRLFTPGVGLKHGVLDELLAS